MYIFKNIIRTHNICFYMNFYEGINILPRKTNKIVR